ncbi:MAG: hypothetical protein HY904_15000 [Deltaproteobacteria bacterium]|nr:hypothetical protein [Deltaproteobacteria bacterium]
MRSTAWWLAVVLLSACSTGDGGGTSSSSGGGSGGGCGSAADCPAGFACKARACVTSCTSSQPLIGGCVNGAQCNNGSCVLNTTCNETTECAYDKGQVCDFAQGTCVTASETCSEGENETLCNNGYLCHIDVCYFNCSGAKGCPAGKTCQADHTCL